MDKRSICQNEPIFRDVNICRPDVRAFQCFLNNPLVVLVGHDGSSISNRYPANIKVFMIFLCVLHLGLRRIGSANVPKNDLLDISIHALLYNKRFSVFHYRW